MRSSLIAIMTIQSVLRAQRRPYARGFVVLAHGEAYHVVHASAVASASTCSLPSSGGRSNTRLRDCSVVTDNRRACCARRGGPPRRLRTVGAAHLFTSCSHTSICKCSRGGYRCCSDSASTHGRKHRVLMSSHTQLQAATLILSNNRSCAGLLK